MPENGNIDSYTVKEMLSQIIIPALQEIRETAVVRDERHNERLNGLEGWRNRIVGALAVISAILIPVSVPVIITIIKAYHG